MKKKSSRMRVPITATDPIAWSVSIRQRPARAALRPKPELARKPYLRILRITTAAVRSEAAANLTSRTRSKQSEARA